ncbi:MAG: hypothetical protein K6B46_06170 [Opitutales bacterium]|nr:hypothetical protein [Opitutales bacterium]
MKHQHHRQATQSESVQKIARHEANKNRLKIYLPLLAVLLLLFVLVPALWQACCAGDPAGTAGTPEQAEALVLPPVVYVENE